MRLTLTSLVPLALLSLSVAAHAADLSYNVTGGTLTPSGTFSGSFLINASTEMIDGGQFTVTAPSTGTTYNFASSVGSTTQTAGLDVFTDSLGDMFRLALNGAVTNLNFNTVANGLGSDTALILANGTQFNFSGGTITLGAVAARTPEPSSLILLGTGALGLAGSFRRRLLA